MLKRDVKLQPTNQPTNQPHNVRPFENATCRVAQHFTGTDLSEFLVHSNTGVVNQLRLSQVADKIEHIRLQQLTVAVADRTTIFYRLSLSTIILQSFALLLSYHFLGLKGCSTVQKIVIEN